MGQNSPLEHGFGPKRSVAITYDFSKHGGAIGTISLTPKLPDDALVVSGMIHVKTALVGSSATVALHLLTADDVYADGAITAFSLAATLAVVPLAAASSLKMTAATALTMTISTAALTAGKFTCYLDYYMGD